MRQVWIQWSIGYETGINLVCPLAEMSSGFFAIVRHAIISSLNFTTSCEGAEGHDVGTTGSTGQRS